MKPTLLVEDEHVSTGKVESVGGTEAGKTTTDDDYSRSHLLGSVSWDGKRGVVESWW